MKKGIILTVVCVAVLAVAVIAGFDFSSMSYMAEPKPGG